MLFDLEIGNYVLKSIFKDGLEALDVLERVVEDRDRFSSQGESAFCLDQKKLDGRGTRNV